MKTLSVKSYVVLRSFILISSFSLGCFLMLAVKAKNVTEDVWSQLGLTLPDAQLNIKNSILNGTLYYYGARNAKNILSNNRAAVINDMVAYAKKYTASAEFKTIYKKEREIAKPKPFEFVAATPEAVKSRERQRLENNLKAAEEGLNSTNPKIKNGAQQRIDNIKKDIAALDDPNNKNIQRLVDQEKRQYEGVAKQNDDALKAFELRYPEDPQVLIKKRLEEILSTTSDVDYSAELKDAELRGKKISVFVNPDYEKKPKDWKLAFRAGKSATDVVRAAAEKWLKELK